MKTRFSPYRIVSLFFISVLSLTGVAGAQSTGAVAGRVVDADGTPLPGVNVVLQNASRGTATDTTGRFRIDDVSAGPDTIRARFVGYRTTEQAVTIVPDDVTRVTLALRAEAVTMPGVEVSALRPSLNPSDELGRQQVQEAEVADPGALLRDLPGVSAVRRGPMGLDPNVRGLSETEVGVYIDGMRTFPAGPARMDSPMSHIDPSTIASVNVVKGPYALTWGPSNMSAVRVTRRGADPPRTPLTGSVRTGYDTNRGAAETTGFVMGRQGRWFYSANGAWRRGNDFDAGNGTNVPGDFSSVDGRGRLGVELTDQSTLALSGSYQDQNDIDYPGRLLNATFFETGMGTLEYELDRETGTLRALTVRASAQQTLHEMDNQGKPTFEAGTLPSGSPRPPLRIGVRSEIQNYSGRIAADLSTGAWALTVGGDVVHTFRNATRSLEAVMSNGSRMVPPFYRTSDGELLDNAWPGVTTTQEGVFVEATRSVGIVTLTGTGRLDLAQSDANNPTGPFLENAGVTADALDQQDTMLNGSLTASVPVADQWTLSLGAGSVARPPDALERYADRFPASKSQTSAEFQGIPSLDPERSTQGDVWLEGTGAQWTASVNAFARHIDDYITPAPTTLDPILPLSPSTVYRYSNGEATFVGADVSGSVRPTSALTLRASGSYLWGRDETLDEPAFGVSPPSADLGLRWAPAFRYGAVSNPFVDASTTLTARQVREAETRGEDETDGYTTVDLKAGVQFLRRAEFTVGVENLFDTTYANHLNAKNPFSGDQISEPGRVFTTNLAVSF